MRDIGKHIRELRTQNGMSQEVLAGSLYVTRQTVSNYETGKSRPDIETITKLTELFHTDANTILYGTPSQEERNRITRTFVVSSLILAVMIAAELILFLIQRCGEQIY